MSDNMEDDEIKNATQGELEELNGLLIRELSSKIKDGTANGTTLSTAAKLIISNKVAPVDPKARVITYERPVIFSDLDFPVDVNAEDT